MSSPSPFLLLASSAKHRRQRPPALRVRIGFMLPVETPEVYTRHKSLADWVNEAANLCQPDAVRWCNGSQREYDELCQQMVNQGTFIRLNPELRPNSFLARSDPDDVAR